jgi:hypothetical protein
MVIPDSDTQHLMPNIYTLRGITPGKIPKLPDVPTGIHQPSEQAPPSSYLNKLMMPTNEPDPTNPDSSDSDGSDSVSPQLNSQKHNQMKHRAYTESKTGLKQGTKIKIDPPEQYDSSPDFDAYKRWSYAINAWFEITAFPEQHRVKQMLAFMTGKAAQFYMTFVAPDPGKWTVPTLAQGLFDHCFSPAFRRQMQVRFLEFNQGKRSA